jgi:protein ImuB
MQAKTTEASASRRCLGLWLPHLPTDRIRRRERAQPGATRSTAAAPLALTMPVKGALRLAAVSAEAAARGLHAGQTLADARALCPALSVEPADPQADAALICAVADWTRRYTPLAATDGPDGVILDISGCAHLFGGEGALVADLLSRLARQGFTGARAAVAGTPEAAWALARHAPEARRLCPPGKEEAFLRPLPAEALRLDAETVRALAVAGLTRVEDLWLRPRAPIAARFGRHVVERLEAAFGLARSALTPRLAADPYVAERRFFEPILTREQVLHALERLCGEAARMLTRHGEGARRLELMLFRVDGATFRMDAGLSRPSREPVALFDLMRERLTVRADERDVGYGFDVVRLSVLEAARLDETSPRLDARPGDEELSRLVDRLGARLGADAVTRLEAADSYVPELASISRPAHRPAARASSARTMASQPWDPLDAPGDPPGRPILLLAEPEPVETLAAVPDGPPLRFRWRKVLHDVAAVEGPERIALPWWGTAAPPTRDYFRAEDRQGRRFWLCREGLYDRETPAPRWFVHGLFG